MSNEIWERRRQQLEEEVSQALLKLFEHMGNPASVIFKLEGETWVKAALVRDPASS